MGLPHPLTFRVLVAVFVCATAGSATAGPGAALRPTRPASPHESMLHVRTTDDRIRRALAIGAEKAPTLRGLLEELEASDVILYVEPGECGCGRARACVTFVTMVEGIRYLRATVSPLQLEIDLISHIGHELRHATELAAARQVVSRETFKEFYTGASSVTCRAPCGYETLAAIRTQSAVRTELQFARAGGRQ